MTACHDRPSTRAPRGDPHPAAELRVAGEPVDVAAEVVAVAGLVEEAGHAVVHDVDRAAGARGDDGDAGGERLLGGLAVGLVPAGVHEHVQGGVRAAELGAVQDPEEACVGQQPPEPALLGAPSDDHQRVAGVAGEVGEQLQLLLRGEPADVPHQDPAVRSELPAQPLVAEPGVERVEVDTTRPQRQPRDRQVLELSELAVDGARVRSTRVWILRVR